MKKLTFLAVLSGVVGIIIAGCGGSGTASGGHMTTTTGSTTATTGTTGMTGTTGNNLQRWTVNGGSPNTELVGVPVVKLGVDPSLFAAFGSSPGSADQLVFGASNTPVTVPAGATVQGVNSGAWATTANGQVLFANLNAPSPQFTPVAAGYTFQMVVPGAQPVAYLAKANQLYVQQGANPTAFQATVPGQAAYTANATTNNVLVMNNGVLQAQNPLGNGAAVATYTGVPAFAAGTTPILSDANELYAATQNGTKVSAQFWDGKGSAAVLSPLKATDNYTVPTAVSGSTVFGYSGTTAATATGVAWIRNGNAFTAVPLESLVDNRPTSTSVFTGYMVGTQLYLVVTAGNSAFIYPATPEGS